jgi:hypothetical protein
MAKDKKEKKATPWWHNYPTYMGRAQKEDVLKIKPRMIQFNYGADPGWGPLGQFINALGAQDIYNKVRETDVKIITWMEAFGTCFIYVAAFQKNSDGSFTSVDTEKIKLIVVIFSTIMVAAATAAAGQVSWIGLVIPHIARFIVGSKYKYYLPASALLGGFSLLLMDNIARTLSGAEIPISIITALIGAPFFAYLLITTKESGWS